jgi:hypothetical protein
MHPATRAPILGITSTQETRSEEDGVENRSEPQGWLADGSPDGADPAQDADQSAGVKTALSTADTQAPEADGDAGPDEAEQSAPYDGGTATFTSPSWETAGTPYESSTPSYDNGASTYGSASSPYENGGSSYDSGSGTAASPGGATAPPGWPSPPADGAPAAAEAGLGNGYAGASPAAGGPATASYAAPQAPPAAFPSPPPSRPRPARPGKASRPQSRPAAQRPAANSASTRKAQLAVSRIEPWSVMKFSFMISLVGWVILFVAVAIMYFVLQKLGVFHSIENTVGLVTASKNHSGTDAASWFSASRVLGYTMLVGAINVILITALATVGAVLYNLVTMLAGGIEVTLKETD